MTAQRRDRAISSIGVWLLSAVLLVWTLLPIYNIIRVSIQEKEEVLSTSVFPIAPSPHAFSVVFRATSRRTRVTSPVRPAAASARRTSRCWRASARSRCA